MLILQPRHDLERDNEKVIKLLTINKYIVGLVAHSNFCTNVSHSGA